VKKRCPKCGHDKELILFALNKKAKLGRASWCRACTSEAGKRCRQNKPKHYRDYSKEYHEKHPFATTCKNIKKTCRKRGWPFTIKQGDLRHLWESQAGKCYWSGMDMSLVHGRWANPKSVSVDRLDCSKGYVLDNIVLCCSWANMGRQQTPTARWIELMKEMNLTGLWDNNL
jgi:hypothetical protein